MRLSGEGNSNLHGARPVRRIISMIKWIWASRLSTENSPSITVLAPRSRLAYSPSPALPALPCSIGPTPDDDLPLSSKLSRYQTVKAMFWL